MKHFLQSKTTYILINAFTLIKPTMHLKGIKLVTFDATNTILAFKIPPWEYYASVAQEYGYRGDVSQFKLRFRNSYKSMWDKYPNFGKNTISWPDWWRRVVISTLKDQHVVKSSNLDHIADQLINEYKTQKCWTFSNGGLKLLQAVKDNGSLIGVISNFDPRLHDILKNLNIYSKFDFVLTSYEVGFFKPDERIFEEAVRKCKKPVQAFECLHVGDDLEKDYFSARSAGWYALLVNKNLKTEETPVSKHVFNSLDELTLAIETDTLIFS